MCFKFGALRWSHLGDYISYTAQDSDKASREEFAAFAERLASVEKTVASVGETVGTIASIGKVKRMVRHSTQ